MNQINKGNILSVEITKEQPKFEYNFEKDTYYTLIMIDPGLRKYYNTSPDSWKLFSSHWIKKFEISNA
jgi:hypothetical protein